MKEQDNLADSFEPYEFSNAIYKKLQELLASKEKEDKKKGPQTAMVNTEFRIIKTAQSDIKVPSAEDLSFYIETFNLYLKETPDIDENIKKLIKNLPPSKQIKKHFSASECKVLFETVNYLWRKITGNDINEEAKLETAPETLSGNYWIFKHGFIFSGKNHYLIIKRNLNVFTSMLGLNMFTLQEYLSSDPNKLIFYIIKNGGVRMFIDKNKKAFFQMTPQTYAEWGKERVKKYKFDHKIVRVIDIRADYKGWKSGVAVRLR